MRWLLPMFLAAAVLGMHHLPAADTDTHHSAVAQHENPPPVSTVGDAGPPTVSAADCCSASMAESGDDAPGGHGHDLLHLCLAILMALVGGLLTGRWLLSIRGGSGPTAVAVGVRGVPRPVGRPPPVARRLAALGVLRL